MLVNIMTFLFKTIWHGNLPESEICSKLTGYDAPFWYKHSQECWDILTRKGQFLESLTLLIASLLIMFHLWCLCVGACLLKTISKYWSTHVPP